MSLHIGDAVLRILGDTHDVEAKVGQLGGRLRSLVPGATKMALIGLAAGATGAGVAALGSVKAFGSFEDSMLNTRTILSGMTDGEFADLSNKVIELGKQFPEATGGADQLSAALYQAVSSGIPAANALDFLKVAAEGATGGATDTASVVQALAGTLNAYHLSADQAQHVSDVLFQTVNLGVVDMGTLSGTLSNVSAVAAAAGVSLEETGAGIATLTKQNIPAAEATTDLRGAIEAIVNANGPMLKALNAAGYATGQQALHSLGLEGTLGLLSKAVGNNTQKWFDFIPRIEGVQAALGLTGKNAKMAKSDFDAMHHASDGLGAAHTAFAIKEKGLAASWERMVSVSHSLAISMGEKLAPAAQFVIEQFTDILNGTGPLGSAIKFIKDQIGAAIGDFIGLGVSLFQSLGGIPGLVSGAKGGFTSFINVVRGLITTFTTQVLPKLQIGFNAVMNVIKASLPIIVPIFKQVFTLIGSVITWFTTAILPTLQRWVSSIVQWVVAHWPEISNVIKIVVTIAAQMIQGFIQIFQLALAAIQNIWPAIEAVIETVMAVISGVISVILDLISGNWGKAWDDVKAMLVGVWNGILKFIGSIPKLLLGILQALLVAVMVWAGALAGKLLGWAGGLVGRFVGWFAKIPGEAMGAIGGFPGRLLGFLGSLLGRVVGWLGSLIGKFIHWFTKIPGDAVEGLASLPGKIIDFLLGIPGKIAGAAADIGKHIISGIVDGVTGAVGGAISSVTGAVGNIVGGVGNFLGIHSPSTVFAEIGKQSMAGLAVGLADHREPMAALRGSVSSLMSSNPLTLAASTAGANVARGEGDIHIHGSISLPNVTNAKEFVSELRHMAATRSVRND